MEDLRNAYTILVGNLEGKRPLVKPMGRCKYNTNIKIDLKEYVLKI
jgi:hypothetical protein